MARQSTTTQALAILLAALASACGGADAPETGAAASAFPPSGGEEAAAPAIAPAMIAGDPDGPLVIREYADFECPFCARHYLENHEAIEALLEQGGIRFEVYELAGPAHPEALDATVAARCAGDQGAYAEARDALYRNQATWTGSYESDTLVRALVLPLVRDTAELDDCLDNQRVTVGRILNQNLRRALAEGTRSTPTTVVQQGDVVRVLPGVVGADAIAAAVEAVRQEAGSTATEGAS